MNVFYILGCMLNFSQSKIQSICIVVFIATPALEPICVNNLSANDSVREMVIMFYHGQRITVTVKGRVSETSHQRMDVSARIPVTISKPGATPV